MTAKMCSKLASDINIKNAGLRKSGIFDFFGFKNKQKKVEFGLQARFEQFRHFVDHVLEIYSKCSRIPK